MKTFTIIRHAKSGWAGFSVSDFERPLDDTGLEEAPLMAKRLLQQNIKPDFFVSSPALRARTTCEKFCEVFHQDIHQIEFHDTLYHAPAEEIYRVISTLPNEYNNVALFCHNPGITDFVNSLSDEFRLDDMPPCGLLSVEVPVTDWALFEAATKKILFFDYPKNQSSFSSK